MNCIIVDDEPLAVEGMKLNVNQVPSLELLNSFNTAMAANEFLSQNEVDLMFLDIHMPGLTGLEFLRSLKHQPLVILTTAYPQFALEAFELDVLDYLVKPIRFDRFVKAVNKAEAYLKLQSQSHSTVDSIAEDHIYIRADRKFVKIRFDEVQFIQGLKDYVVIHTVNDKIMTAMNLRTIHSKLPAKFFARISKSYLVNVQHVDAFDNDTIYVTGDELPLGKSYKEVFKTEYVDKNLVGR